MGFNKEDKVRWEELAPSLQEMFNGISNSITNLDNNINITGDNSVTDISISNNGTELILYKGDGTVETILTIDTELNGTSLNPVQNKAIYAAIQSLSATLNSINSRISTLDTNISTLSSSLNALTSRVTSLESNVSSLTSRASTLESNVASIAARTSSLETKVNSSSGGSSSGGSSDNTHGCPGK